MNDFKDRLLDEWLSPFCERHGYVTGGFVSESVEKLDPNDAADFLSAIDEGLVIHDKCTKKSAWSSPVACAFFWALGPGNRGVVFEVQYGANEEVLLVQASESSLVCNHA